MPEKPSIFVSSTIHDFRDLRSALRHYLSSLGFDVYLSDCNDFPKPLDKNTFDASLATLRSADIYVLLVGSRVGGLYDEQEGISITRKEYQTAYQLAKEGRQRLALFVREEIWVIRRDRAALQEFLTNAYRADKELSEREIQEIVNHPSPMATNAELIFDFLKEITREDEVKEALADNTIDLPPANWVHSFSGFQDIVDVLRLQLGIGTPLSRIAMKANLRRELIDNLIILLKKHDGQVDTSYTWASFARQHLQGDMNSSSQMPARYLRRTLIYSITVSRSKNISTQFIDQALRSGEFLEYQRESASYVSGLLNERLFELRNRIEVFRLLIESFREPLNQLFSQYRDVAKQEDDVVIPNQDLIFPLALADIEEDILRLSIALIRALDGDERFLSLIELNPPNPLMPEAERIRGETPSRDEVEAWVRSQARVE